MGEESWEVQGEEGQRLRGQCGVMLWAQPGPLKSYVEALAPPCDYGGGAIKEVIE